MTVYCNFEECDCEEDGLCYADRIELDGNGVCLSCRFAEKHDKDDEE